MTTSCYQLNGRAAASLRASGAHRVDRFLHAYPEEDEQRPAADEFFHLTGRGAAKRRRSMGMTWLKRVAVAATMVVGVSALAASCGGNGSNSAGGSGGTGPGSECSLNNAKCAIGCAPNLGCVDCKVNTDCNSVAPICALGRCSECVNDVDCGAGKACYQRAHTCETKCKTNADCAAVEPFCDTKTGECAGCLTNADCAAPTPVCDPHRRQCSECATNADCGAAKPACDWNDGQCHECLVDADCPTSSQCGTDRQCHFRCSVNADCHDPGKPRCDAESGECVRCLVSADCPAAQPHCRNDDHCVECVVDADCKQATSPFCKDSDHCVECRDDADCPAAAPKCKGEHCGT